MPQKGKLWRGVGTGAYGPRKPSYRLQGENVDKEDWSRHWFPRGRVEVFEDFQYKGSATAPLPWTKAVVGTTPTGDFLANTKNGQYKLLLAATSEAESARLDFADQLLIPATSRFIFQVRLAKSAIATAQRVIFGLATAYTATQDNITENIWFRYEASDVLKFEGDDNTTDTALTTSSPSTTNTADAFNLYTIDGRDISNIRFHIDDNDVGGIALSALTAAMVLQPYVIVQKDSGTGVPYCILDYIRCEYDRL